MFGIGNWYAQAHINKKKQKSHESYLIHIDKKAWIHKKFTGAWSNQPGNNQPDSESARWLFMPKVVENCHDLPGNRTGRV